MDICLISDREVGRLKHYGIVPDCSEHGHLTFQETIDGLLDESLVRLETEHGHYVYRSKLYFLIRRNSGPLKVIQRLLSNSPLFIMKK
jgi:hypothetical protein